jgi:two-component system chemotaxis response regulator CheB
MAVTERGLASTMDTAHLPYFLAIGASGAEGLHDIQSLLGALPEPTPAVVMVVMHRPSDQVSHLREILARNSGMPIIIAEEAEWLEPNTCYIGEPDHHLTLVDHHIAHLVEGAGHRLRNRTIDTLFNSLAIHAGSRVIGVVLSGALDDGSRGLAAIHAARGITMVLDPGNKPQGMQQNAINYTGLISFVGTAPEIAGAVRDALA